MKKVLLSILSLASVVHFSEAKNLNALFSYCTFYQPVKGPYIETYLNVSGNSVQLIRNAENKLQGKIEVQWIYKQGDKIVHFDKYNLLSPTVDDTSQQIQDFTDQQRIPLDNGDYTIELKITDKNSSERSFTSTQNISIHYPEDKIIVSDIEFVESYSQSSKPGAFTKNGYEIVPLVYNYFPVTMTSLKFYAEIYHAKEILGDEDILITYNISGHQSRSIISNLASSKKQKASTVNILIAELPLAEVSSGNYFLNIEVRNKTNKVLASKQAFFQRINPPTQALRIDDFSSMKIDNTFVSYMTDKDTLRDYIASLYPISGQFEANAEENQLNLNSLEMMQRFFYYFWSKRNPQDPQQAWLDYNLEVQKVNAKYKSVNSKGYATDRGRVYLQYGPPNDVFERYSEPERYPYEIWHYYSIGRQTDGKFIFYTRNLTTNDFELLHSNVTGEVNNQNWQMNLSTISRSMNGGDIDAGETDKQDHQEPFGTRAKEEFDHPK